MHAIDMWETYELNEFRWKILKAHRLPVFLSFPFNFVCYFFFGSFDCYLNFWFWNPNFFFLVFCTFFCMFGRCLIYPTSFNGCVSVRKNDRFFFSLLFLIISFKWMDDGWMNHFGDGDDDDGDEGDFLAKAPLTVKWLKFTARTLRL